MTRKEILAAFIAELRFQNSALKLGGEHGLTNDDLIYISVLCSVLKRKYRPQSS
jgi:hypothetical protein